MDALDTLLKGLNQQVAAGKPIIVNTGGKQKLNPALQGFGTAALPAAAAAAAAAAAPSPAAAAAAAAAAPSPAAAAAPINDEELARIHSLNSEGRYMALEALTPQQFQYYFGVHPTNRDDYILRAEAAEAAAAPQPAAAAAAPQPAAAAPPPQGPCDLPLKLLIKDGSDFTDTVTLIHKIYNIKRVFDRVIARTEGTLKFIEKDYSKDNAKRVKLVQTKLAVKECHRNITNIWECARGQQEGYSWNIDVDGIMKTIMMGTPTAWLSVSEITDSLPEKGKETFIRIFYTLDILISQAKKISTTIVKFLYDFNIDVDSMGVPLRTQPPVKQTMWQWVRGQPFAAPTGASASLIAYSTSLNNLLAGAYNENILVPSFVFGLIRDKSASYPILTPVGVLFRDGNDLQKYIAVLILAYTTVAPPTRPFASVQGSRYLEQPYETLEILEYLLAYILTIGEAIRSNPRFTDAFNRQVDSNYPVPDNLPAGTISPNTYFKQAVSNDGINTIITRIRRRLEADRETFRITELPTRTFAQAREARWYGGSKRRRVKRGSPSRKR